MFWHVPGCSGMFQDVLVCSGMYWDVLGCSRMFWDVLGCTETYWDVLGSTRMMFWDVLRCSGVFWNVQECVLGCSGKFWDVLGCSWMFWCTVNLDNPLWLGDSVTVRKLEMLTHLKKILKKVQFSIALVQVPLSLAQLSPSLFLLFSFWRRANFHFIIED